VDVFVTKPDVALRDAFLQMLDDYDAHDPDYGSRYAAARSGFRPYIQNLHDDERGLVGVVTCSHRRLQSSEWCVCGASSPPTSWPMKSDTSATMSHHLTGDLDTV
jgi:hypothetical protein